MNELFDGPLPPEPLATCSACAKLPKPGEPPPADAYHPDTKCCTYLPMLHNFLVGALLADPDPAFATGRATVEARIDSGEGMTPLGLYATQEYLSRYDAGARFGKDLSLRCPHYLHDEGGRCGVWRHRESTCSTWFCFYDRGEAGKEFWRDGVAPMLRAAELSLAAHCAHALGADEINFGRWEGQPRELYRAAAELVVELTWAEVAALAGSEVQKLARVSRERLAALRR